MTSIASWRMKVLNLIWNILCFILRLTQCLWKNVFKTYKLLTDHFTTAKPEEKDLDDMIVALQSWAQSQCWMLQILQAWSSPWRKCLQLCCFVELRQLDFNCKFGQNVNEAMHNRFVCGLQVELYSPKETTLSERPYLYWQN